ncbi:sensor histidine kinase [Lachnospiraceae bacterium ZAX-1]
MKKRKQTKSSFLLIDRISTSGLFTVLVTSIVVAVSFMSLLTFIKIYRDAMEENAITNSEQAVVQVKNTVDNYTEDISLALDMIHENISNNQKDSGEFLKRFLEVREDVVAISIYDKAGSMLSCWSNGQKLKDKILRNPSFVEEPLHYNGGSDGGAMLNITKPHVESLFVNYYPWVVTISQYIRDSQGKEVQLSVDIRFYNIASYVDDVGIGQHGYCYIVDGTGNIIYHPQQQLIYSGLMEENHGVMNNGTYIKSDAIYTVNPLENCDWHIVGVCYVDEMITSKVDRAVGILSIILLIVSVGTLFIGSILSQLFSKPVRTLATAMGEFEKNIGDYIFYPVSGTREVDSLSDSFGNMVIRIKELMEQVRQEEISLRKTELKALQAQINPHFLYNTLDAIAWLCEEERSHDAVEMVNALARLFRISISKGHELIPIERELQHAESYLQIQNYRYKNQFQYSIDVDPECLKYLCNKITLQPIIENAIYHGIERMVDEGMIAIGIHQRGDDIIFTVEDNGIGMTLEECKEVLNREPGDRVGIGIKNVHERIRIYFGSEYGLSITSELDEGTCVTICMPKITENSYEEN